MRNLTITVLSLALASFATCPLGSADGTASFTDQTGTVRTATRCNLTGHITSVAYNQAGTNDLNSAPAVVITLDVGPTSVAYFPGEPFMGTMEQSKAFLAMAMSAQSENRSINVVFLDNYLANVTPEWRVNFLLGLGVGN
jgi:hypothetical protein